MEDMAEASVVMEEVTVDTEVIGNIKNMINDLHRNRIKCILTKLFARHYTV
jgi:hypothetical protein